MTEDGLEKVFCGEVLQNSPRFEPVMDVHYVRPRSRARTRARARKNRLKIHYQASIEDEYDSDINILF
jgi:hypothetical protein